MNAALLLATRQFSILMEFGSIYKLHKHNTDTSPRTIQQTNLSTCTFHLTHSGSRVFMSAFFYSDFSGV